MRASSAVVLGILLSGCVLSNDLDERIPAVPGGRLEVDIDLGEGLRPDPGSLEISAHEADEIWLSVDVSGWGAQGVRFRVDRSERAVRIYGRVGGAFSFLFGGPRVAVRLWVPQEHFLDLRTSAGPIRVEDVHGDVRARAAGGAIEVVSAEGPLRLRAAGDVRVSEVVGDVDVKTSSGELALSWITGSLDARTDRGGIDVSHVEGPVAVASGRGAIELRDVRGPIDAKTERGGVFASFTTAPEGTLGTERGGVQVLVPAGHGAQLDAESYRGAVEIGPEVAFHGEADESRAVGAIFDGGAPLRLYTARGSVQVGER